MRYLVLRCLKGLSQSVGTTSERSIASLHDSHRQQNSLVCIGYSV